MTDLEIAQQNEKKDLRLLVQDLGLKDEDVAYYGKDKAKILKTDGFGNTLRKLILVTAINPTPYGEGKTTVSIGLGDALQQLKKRVMIVLRQPSMGPVFGMKGGATGGGYSQVVPMEDINLHFTGDFHAITACNNLLCAAIDNHIKQGNALHLDVDQIMFQRCLDVNDRALREVQVGLGGAVNGRRRTEHFTITAASEIMSIFCLSNSLLDLRKRLGNILVGYTDTKKPVFAKDLKIEGAMTVLLKDAIAPNLVQTLEHTPTLIHGGPFANIAHGCNSIVATKLGLSLADYVVTEAGFGSDLGAEKFLDIKCPEANLRPNCLVLVATTKALKYNANVSKEDILKEDVEAVHLGLCNLDAHIENLQKYHVPLLVCLNRYDTDSDREIEVIHNYCAKKQILFAVSDAYRSGGRGAIDLAEQVVKMCDQETQFEPIYRSDMTIKEKIGRVAREIYHAGKIVYTEQAEESILQMEENGFDKLPICIAKTQYSLSDDPKKLGSPRDYTITVRDLRLYHGAGFITVLLGDIMTMPGLPKVPNYEKIDLDEEGKIVGLF